MRIELTDGETLDLTGNEARDLYQALLERARQYGAISAAGKLRTAVAWSSASGAKVALNRSETAAAIAVRNGEPNA